MLWGGFIILFKLCLISGFIWLVSKLFFVVEIVVEHIGLFRFYFLKSSVSVSFENSHSSRRHIVWCFLCLCVVSVVLVLLYISIRLYLFSECVLFVCVLYLVCKKECCLLRGWTYTNIRSVCC